MSNHKVDVYLHLAFVLEEDTDIDSMLKEIFGCVSKSKFTLILLAENTTSSNFVSKIEVELATSNTINGGVKLSYEDTGILYSIMAHVRRNSRNRDEATITTITDRSIRATFAKYLAGDSSTLHTYSSFIMRYGELMKRGIVTAHDDYTDVDQWISYLETHDKIHNTEEL